MLKAPKPGYIELRIGDITGLSRVKIAFVSLGDVVKSNSPFKKNSHNCSVALRNFNATKGTWSWGVRCGELYSDSGGHTVNVKLLDNPAESEDKKDIRVKINCDCPAFLWWGSQYHLYNEGALLGSPRGLLKSPDVRDPNKQNLVCKHIYAVINRMLSKFEWEKGPEPESSESKAPEYEGSNGMAGPFSKGKKPTDEAGARVKQVKEMLTPEDLNSLNNNPPPLPGEEDLTGKSKEEDRGPEEIAEIPKPNPEEDQDSESDSESELNTMLFSPFRPDNREKPKLNPGGFNRPPQDGNKEQEIAPPPLGRLPKVKDNNKKDQPESADPFTIQEQADRLRGRQQQLNPDLKEKQEKAEAAKSSMERAREDRKRRMEEARIRREQEQKAREDYNIRKEDARRQRELDRAIKRQQQRQKQKEKEEEAYNLEDKLVNQFNRSRRSSLDEVGLIVTAVRVVSP